MEVNGTLLNWVGWGHVATWKVGGNALAKKLASPHLGEEVEQLVQVDGLRAVGNWRRITRVDLRVDSICQLCQLVKFFFSIPEKSCKF